MKKLVVITGASSGIGAVTAKLLSKAGHPLLLLARRVEKLEELNLPNSICRRVDVTDINSFKEAIREAEGIYGKTDLLINNAGVMLLGDVSKQEPQEWKRMIDVNILGVLNGIGCVLEDMIGRSEGTIINISSIAGRKTFPNHAAYCATKFGVHALTENIREEVSGSNVRMITIAPGATETELLSHTTDQSIKDGYEVWKETMGGKAMNPIHVAESIEFAYNMPQNVCIREIVIAATKQNA